MARCHDDATIMKPTLANLGLIPWLFVLPHLAMWAQTPHSTEAPSPGASGNPENVPFIGGKDLSGNPVRLAQKTGHVSNYDPAHVGKYTLPDPLVSSDGNQITTKIQWESKRRGEILSWYRSQIYGAVPPSVKPITWRAMPGDISGTRIYEGTITDHELGHPIRLSLQIPQGRSGPCPLLLNLSFFPPSAPDSPPQRPQRFQPKELVLARGWAYAQMGYGDIQPDRPNRWEDGVIGSTLSAKQDRPLPDQWGTISAWAWGASQALDLLETMPEINRKLLCLTGASRLGKTALWAAAQDERIAAVMSIVPGEMGASLIRRDWGETLDDMAQNFHWQFAGNLQQWVGKWDHLPVDQHMLLALIAPRKIYINGGLTDQWSDPEGQFLAMKAAEPVFELLGAGNLGANAGLTLDKPLMGTHMAYHYHSKGHQSLPEDWHYFMDFAEGKPQRP